MKIEKETCAQQRLYVHVGQKPATAHSQTVLFHKKEKKQNNKHGVKTNYSFFQ